MAYNQAPILKYNGSGTSITIPSTLDDFSVISIGDRVFKNCTDITSITIPDSVISICNWVFKNCTDLTSVTIGNSVTSINLYAFFRCNSLTKISCYYEAVDKPEGWNVGWDSNLSITWEYLGD